MQTRPRPALMVLLGIVGVVGGLLVRRLVRVAPVAPAVPAPASVRVEPDTGVVSFEPVPAGSLVARSFYFDAVLEFDQGPPPVKAVVGAIPALAAFQLRETPAPPSDDKPSFVLFEGAAVDEFAPLGPKELDLFGVGLSEADRARHQKTRFVAAFSFHGPVDAQWKSLRAVLSGVRDLADKTGGMVYDASARQLLSREAWRLRVEAFRDGVPDVVSHTTSHTYREGDLMRIVTLGMAQFGLPDVTVERVAMQNAPRMSQLVGLVCQTMVERGRTTNPGELVLSFDTLTVKPDLTWGAAPQRKATLSIAIAKPKKGDADNRMIELTFPGDDSGLQQRQAKLLSSFFGSSEQVVGVDPKDEKIAAASARAKAKLLLLKPEWTKGPQGLDHLIVKAPFATPGGSLEWMWVEVTGWKGTKLQGILQNDAFEIPGLTAGAHVEAEETAIFDYMLRRADGSHEGGETNALISKQP